MVTPFLEEITADLRRDEGEVLHAYPDHLGYLTIGIGRLIDKRKGGGITAEESAYLLRNDIARFMGELDRRMSWWRKLDRVRQRAILNMAFQMGAGALVGTPTFKLIQDGNYSEGSDRLTKWKWARQTPERAARVIHMMRTGTDPA